MSEVPTSAHEVEAIAAFREAVAIAEAPDSRVEAWRIAAENALTLAESGWSHAAIGRLVGHEDRWAQRVIAWARNPSAPTPFARVEGESERKDAEATTRVLKAAPPETVERIVAELPPERRDAIVDAVVMTEGVKRPRSPAPAPAPSDQGWAPRKILGEAVLRAYRAWSRMQDELPPDDDLRTACIALAHKLVRYGEGIERLLSDGDIDSELEALWREIES